MTARLGVGKVRHIEVKYLWVQEKVRERILSIKKISTDDNRADMMTKALDPARHSKLTKTLPLRLPVTGCFNEAPACNVVSYTA
jgi:hypothetical protein